MQKKGQMWTTDTPEYRAYMAYENYRYNPKSEGHCAKLKSIY